VVLRGLHFTEGRSRSSVWIDISSLSDRNSSEVKVLKMKITSTMRARRVEMTVKL